MLTSGHIDFEGRARLSASFVEQMVDPVTGQPYFIVFNQAPPQAVHDWPDFGDLTARFLEAALMSELITGYRPANTDRLGQLLLGYFDSGDGLNYRPKTSHTQHVAELFDQGRTLWGLCSWVMAGGDESVRTALRDMVEGLRRISIEDEDGSYYPGERYTPEGWLDSAADLTAPPFPGDVVPGYFVGSLIRPLVRAAELLDYEPALELAVDLARRMVKRQEVFSEDGSFDGHVSSRLLGAAGFMAAGLASGNHQWCELAYRAWQFARDVTLSFGFIPEYVDCATSHHAARATRITSEACDPCDYLDLMILLARNGHDELWDEIDRTVRNQLIEMQITSAQWDRGGEAAPRTDIVLEDRVAERFIGGFTGWSSPDYMWGVTPCFGPSWLGPAADPAIYLNKPRVAMNCCGASGMKGLYQVWSHCVESVPGGWVVHLPLNRWTDGLKVSAPFRDELVIEPERDGSLAVRVPGAARVEQAEADGAVSDHEVSGTYLRWPHVTAGSRLRVRFALKEETTEESLDHPGFGEEVFRVRWRGHTVMELSSVSGGLPDEDSRRLTSLHHVMPLYQGRSEGLNTPEPEPDQSRSAPIVW